MKTQQTSTPISNNLSGKWAEPIVVVSNKNLFINGTWQGLNTINLDDYLKIIENKTEFLARGDAETNFEYKQIIPYVIFNFQEATGESKYFLMQRKTTASESRLANNYSLGIGGHLRKEDLTSSHVFDWARREFNEEINYQDPFTIELLGILNDDSNEVGKVHLGIIILVKGTTNKISIKSELKNGQLLTLKECATHYPLMETWTQIIFNFL